MVVVTSMEVADALGPNRFYDQVLCRYHHVMIISILQHINIMPLAYRTSWSWTGISNNVASTLFSMMLNIMTIHSGKSCKTKHWLHYSEISWALWHLKSLRTLKVIQHFVQATNTGGRFKNTYELLNLRALKISPVNKIHIFQCMSKIFCVEFQRYPLKFHTKYLTHTLNDMIFTQFWNFKSS